MKNMKKNCHIGTSGWHYQHWIGPFYPEDLEKNKMLAYYIRYFSTAEINNSFYRLPSEKVFQNWAKTVPEEFIFSIKASRYITHMKKLKNATEAVNNFMEGIKPIRNHQGPILFQLPPHWRCNPQRLSSFLESLPAGNKYVFEFRDHSWWNEGVYDLLKDHRAAFCIFQLAGELSPVLSTSDFIYIRLHGPDDAYQGSYSEVVLKEWAEKIEQWVCQGKIVYCYFDNDQSGFAVKNSLRLKQILENK
ncbi:MAG: DUF72 domain-containing protein [Atribacterota bacterium]